MKVIVDWLHCFLSTFPHVSLVRICCLNVAKLYSFWRSWLKFLAHEIKLLPCHVNGNYAIHAFELLRFFVNKAPFMLSGIPSQEHIENVEVEGKTTGLLIKEIKIKMKHRSNIDWTMIISMHALQIINAHHVLLLKILMFHWCSIDVLLMIHSGKIDITLRKHWWFRRSH